MWMQLSPASAIVESQKAKKMEHNSPLHRHNHLMNNNTENDAAAAAAAALPQARDDNDSEMPSSSSSFGGNTAASASSAAESSQPEPEPQPQPFRIVTASASTSGGSPLATIESASAAVPPTHTTTTTTPPPFSSTMIIPTTSQQPQQHYPETDGWTGLLADLNITKKTTGASEGGVAGEESENHGGAGEEGQDEWQKFIKLSAQQPQPHMELEACPLDPFRWRIDEWQEPAKGILPEDTFSFLATCRFKSPAFVLAVCTMATQCVVLTLLTIDSTEFSQQDDDSPRNVLGVPPTSVLQVTMSQFLAVMIASLSQTDCLQSLMLWHYGFPQQRIRGMMAGGFTNQSKSRRGMDNDWTNAFLTHIKFRWYFSILMRFGVGFYSGIVTFLLVARSETVRDVMLDFTAVEFVSMLDDTAYMLGTVGFFGRSVKMETDHAIYDRDALVRHPRNLKRTRNSPNLHPARNVSKKIFLVMTRTVLFWINMALLSYVVSGQYNGRYLSDKILVQMGDQGSNLLSTHSGIYQLQVSRLGTSFEYRERGGTGIFIWCNAERAWTLLDSPDDDCASDWKIKSTELDQFAGLLEIADEPWYVGETNNIELRAEYVRIVSMLGVETECEDQESYGWTCSFRNPCQLIAVDARSGPFRDNQQRSWPIEFTLFPDPNVRVYEHPVYYNRQGPERNADLVIFTGRQWAMLTTDIWTSDDNVLSDEELVDILKDFRVYNFGGSLGIRFLSDFVDIGTNNDRGTPVGMRWFQAEATTSAGVGIPRIDERVVVSNQFYCATCDTENSERQCFFDSPCVNKRCVCDGENLGAVCELVPSGNAFCNPSFNKPSFDFDGGDCCARTCLDNADQKCLKSRNGLIDIGNALCRNRNGRYGRRLSLAEPDYTAQTSDRTSVAAQVALTADGRSYALSSRTVDETIMGTRVGTTWTHVGRTHQFGGFRNEIVTLFPNAISNFRRSLPIRGLAASFITRSLSPFYCDVRGCNRQLAGDPTSYENTVVPLEFGIEDYWDPFALSPDGNVMARGVAISTEQGLAYYVDLYVYDADLGWLRSDQTIDLSYNQTVTETVQVNQTIQIIDLSLNQTVNRTVTGSTTLVRQVTRFDEAPLYLSLSGLRTDQSRRLSVSSINFAERSAAELLGPLKTRVYEISSTGRILWNGPEVKTLDRSNMTGKSSQPAFGIPKQSVSLSRNGNVLVIGSLYSNGTIPVGVIKVFESNGTQWKIRQALSLQTNTTGGWTNVLSEDGSVLAVSLPRASSIYRWNGTKYMQLSDQLPFASGTDVSLSQTGETAAFAVPVSGGFSTYAYTNDDAPWCKPNLERLFRVSYTPTSPVTFAWRLASVDNATVASGSWPSDDKVEPLQGTFDPEKKQRRRAQILMEEDEYSRDDPRDLTFVYDHCVPIDVCPHIYRSGNAEANLGVFHGRESVPFSQISPTIDACRMEMTVIPKTA